MRRYAGRGWQNGSEKIWSPIMNLAADLPYMAKDSLGHAKWFGEINMR